MLRSYQPNSPEAVSRVVAMGMIADAKLDWREIDVLDDLNAYAVIGISKNRFLDVVHEYCQDLLREADDRGRIRLVDEHRIDRALAQIDDPMRRIDTCALLLNVLHADGRFTDIELAVLRHALDRWDISLDQLARGLSERGESRSASARACA